MGKKSQKKFIAIFVIIGILLLVGGGITLFILAPFGQGVVNFNNQCSLPSCPSGYTDEGTTCIDKECKRICQKEIGGHCGTFGSEQAVGDIYYMTAETNTNSYWMSPDSPTESTDKCYKYRTATIFTVTDRDPCGLLHANSESHEVYTKDSASKVQPNMVSSTSSSISAGSLWSVGKLGDGTSNKALGRQIPYKGTTPKAGDDSCGSEGELSVYLFYKTASWVKDYDYQEKSCTYECDSSSDCGTLETSGNEYCDGNKVVQDYNTPKCSNYNCAFETTKQTIKTCSDKCENAVCVSGNGDIEGCTDSTALNYNPDATLNDGSCQYGNEIMGCTDTEALNYNPEATISDDSCEYKSNTGYKIVDNECVYTSISSEIKYNSLTKCEEALSGESNLTTQILIGGIIVLFISLIVGAFVMSKKKKK